MKRLFIILMIGFLALSAYSFGVETINTNESLTYTNVVVQFEQAKGIVDEWKLMAIALKDGFSLTMILPLLLLIVSTCSVIGVLVVILLKLIALVTPDNIDAKLLKAEDWITKYIIKIPITILGKLRLLIKKG